MTNQVRSSHDVLMSTSLPRGAVAGVCWQESVRLDSDLNHFPHARSTAHTHPTHHRRRFVTNRYDWRWQHGTVLSNPFHRSAPLHHWRLPVPADVHHGITLHRTEQARRANACLRPSVVHGGVAMSVTGGSDGGGKTFVSSWSCMLAMLLSFKTF